MEESTVRAALYRAFPHHGEIPKHLSHEDIVELRRDLSLLDFESIQRCLPHVLIDLLDTHTNDPDNEEGAEAVIRSLEVKSNTDGYDSDVQLFGRAAADSIRVELDQRDAFRKPVFSRFSGEQAAALAGWLELASKWTDFHYCRSELASALGYWKARSSQDAKGT